ncbi:TPA: ATP-binding protein [Clostridium perfringens]|nr:ATP-binding protein [Clostridium perfringens]HAT4329485.1 ATP-binding protein [Clostridium perfringens]
MNIKNIIVRLQEIEIENLKNVEYGKITLQSYNNLNKQLKGGEIKKTTDIIGVYGQNGSGKTTLIDSISILEKLLLGRKIPKDFRYLINNNNDMAKLNFKFIIEYLDEKVLIDYKVVLGKMFLTKTETNIEEERVVVKEELLRYSNIKDNKREMFKKIIDYKIEASDTIFSPKSTYEKVLECDKNNIINLGVAKAMSIRENTSFIFNNESLVIFNKAFDRKIVNIINSLVYFAKINLFVIKNEQSGIINMNSLLPFSFRVENAGKIISGDYIALFKKSYLNEEQYYILKKIIEQINIVIETIIPEMKIGIEEYGKQLDEEGNLTTEIELTSIRNSKGIPLKYESDGIKKIISILSAIIAMYNNKTICVFIDELDAGIFEYLLGEILGVLKERAKGQLIFTSHNLRALEKLKKESIIFTTTNPKNRYVKLTNVKHNNNLRDFYYRTIALGGQKESLYDETSTFEMKYAFRKAGKILNE